MTLVTQTDGPVTLITGGGSGIGAAATRRLLDLGRRVTVNGSWVDVDTVVVPPTGQAG
jgi:NAD(P)-dependent dehydrogenase (short-subunit alcohol dehydrogenase family)